MDEKELLTRLTMAAKKIVYTEEYLKDILQMLGTQEGAIQAVHAVLAAIEKTTKGTDIPPQLFSKLAVNTYIVMVDIAKDIFKMPPDKGIVTAVVEKLKQETAPKEPQEQMQPPAQEPAQPVQPQGIIAGQVGAPA